MTTANTILSDGWYDPDQAACALAIQLGLYNSQGPTFGPAKWVFSSANPVGNAIDNLLEKLVESRILEKNSDGQLRLASGYDPAKFGDCCIQDTRS